MPCPPDRIGCKISLMETGSKLIKGTAILAESRALTVEEQITFAGVLQAHRSVLQTHSTQTGSQALNYEAKQTYAWILQNVCVHMKPFEANATVHRRECRNSTRTGASVGGTWSRGLATTRALPEPRARTTRS